MICTVTECSLSRLTSLGSLSCELLTIPAACTVYCKCTQNTVSGRDQHSSRLRKSLCVHNSRLRPNQNFAQVRLSSLSRLSPKSLKLWPLYAGEGLESSEYSLGFTGSGFPVPPPPPPPIFPQERRPNI